MDELGTLSTSGNEKGVLKMDEGIMKTRADVPWKQWGWRLLVSYGLWLAADFAAAQMFYMDLPVVGYSERKYQLMELFSFTHMLALLGIGALWYPLCRAQKSLLYPLFACLLLAGFYLTLFQYFQPTYDFRCWMNGMESHMTLGHPYQTEIKPNYWYPPLMAQTLAVTHDILQAWFGKYTRHIKPLVFYFYQSSQFLMTILTFWLTYFFGRDLRLTRRAAAACSFGLVLFNVPLYRLLYYQQPNLWMVTSLLGVLLLRDRAPWIAGFSLALGFHVKLYPAILGLPLLLTRRWRVIIWTGVFTIAIFLIEIKGTNIALWTNFLEQIQNPRWGSYFRDNSMHGIAKNMLKPFGMTHYDRQLTLVFEALAVGWMLARIIRREIAVRVCLKSGEGDRAWIRSAWFNEQAIDTITMSFFVSPIVFEHHYTMAIPVIMWTFAVWMNKAPKRVFWGCLLILLIPIYDVAVFGWNRIAGLIVLIAARGIKPTLAPPEWPPPVLREWFGADD
ncbi:MAG: DUF2029 domain-containing protein [Spartobacteria bacterium]|nr:DUF2029 domain-containing protein [Spartobacteria bacterium]